MDRGLRLVLIWSAALVVSGCGAGAGSSATGSRSPAGIQLVAVCNEAARPVCCMGQCNGDVPGTASCVDGAWTCPDGFVSEAACPTDVPFCQGDTPGCATAAPRCCREACNGDVGASATCSGGAWGCPDGSVSETSCPTDVPFCAGGSPNVDAGTSDAGTGSDAGT